MPFTFSHPALVLPAKYLPERWLSMTALIVGSVTPDFEYFIRMKMESIYSHTWVGMLWFDLPLSLLLTFIYHYLVRDFLICNLPVFLRKRLSRYMGFEWINYFKHNFLKVIICLLIGIASHIFWDGFTHPGGDFVKMIPLLRESTTVVGFRIPYSRLLQYISTIAGGFVVFYAIMRIPKATNYVHTRNPIYYWLIVIGGGLVAANLKIFTVVHYWEYSSIAPALISGALIGSMAAPLLLDGTPAKK